MLRSAIAGGVPALALCLASGLFTACGAGQPTSGADPTATEAASATGSPTRSAGEPASTAAARSSPNGASTTGALERPEAPGPPEPPKATNTAAGRRAFARHVVDAWGYALSTNDARPMLRLGPAGKPCGGCPRLRAELRQRAEQGWYVDFPGAEVRRNEVTTVSLGSTARMTVAIPESESYNGDGSYRSTNPAHPRTSFDVRMRFTDTGFQLLAFRVR